MNTILTLVHEDAGQQARLQAALDLAHGLSGHLVCLDVLSELEPVARHAGAASWLSGADTGGLQRDLPLRDRLAREEIEWEVVRATGDYADCIIQRSGVADIIVLDRDAAPMRSFDAPSLTTLIAIRSGKPILVVPPQCEGFDLYGRALIAWDGSAAAMSALTAAVPLLKWSMTVTIFEAAPEPLLVPGEEAAAYLSSHEIHANVRRFQATDDDVLEKLLDSLVATSADYCVMGACAHSSLHEALFGGVARRLLAMSPVPVVIAH